MSHVIRAYTCTLTEDAFGPPSLLSREQLTSSIPFGIIFGVAVETTSSEPRSRLLRCALDLFAEHGYDAVGVQRVVAAAGVTKPTLYHHFGNKRGLLDALLNTHFAPFNERLRRASAYHHDLTQTLEDVSAAYIAASLDEPNFTRLRLTLLFAPPESEAFRAVAPWLEAQERLLAELFGQASEDHGNMRGRQLTLALSFLGVLNTYVGLSLNGSLTLDDATRSQMLRGFMYGIFS